MGDIEERAKAAAAAPEHVKQRSLNKQTGVDEDAPADTDETNPRDTDHPVGEHQAAKNRENEPPG